MQNGVVVGSKVLLFGLKPATYWFTKINQPLIRLLRTLLIRLLNYVDDWLFSERPELFVQLRFFIINIFRILGWKLSDKKCSFGRSKLLLMLGILINSTLRTFEVPIQKAHRMKALVVSMATDFRNGRPISNLTLRRVTGFAASLKLAVPRIMLWLRPLYKCQLSSKFRGHNRHTPVKLTQEAYDSLIEIPEVIEIHGSAEFGIYSPDVFLYTDASEYGGGIMFRTALGTFEHHVIALPEHLIGTSSTMRELYVVRKAIQLYGHKMAIIPTRKTRVQNTVDAFNATRVIAKPGSKVTELNSEAKVLCDWVDFHTLHLIPNWAPRTHKHLVTCDSLSKLWAAPQPLSAKSWKEISFWYKGMKIVNPTFSNVTNVLNSLRSLDYQTVLVHPFWVGTSWWPLLNSARSSHIKLGTYSVAFNPKSFGYANPHWHFQASCIQPSL
jgi:hypothetical protein